MKIQLTKKESREYFFNALCNGLSYIKDYGLYVEYNEIHYRDARIQLFAKKQNACFEDVLLQILIRGNTLTILDLEDEDNINVISLKEVYERMPKVPLCNLLNMIEEQDDAEDADAILQTVFLNEIIYW